MQAALRRAILKELQPLSDVVSENEVQSVALDVRVKVEDLNADGTPEILAQASDHFNCGATGNCPFWVFQKSRGGYTVLLKTEAQTFTIQPDRTNGYRDLVFGYHDSALRTTLEHYKFRGGKYEYVACHVAEWGELATGRTFPEPRISPCVE